MTISIELLDERTKGETLNKTLKRAKLSGPPDLDPKNPQLLFLYDHLTKEMEDYVQALGENICAEVTITLQKKWMSRVSLTSATGCILHGHNIVAKRDNWGLAVSLCSKFQARLSHSDAAAMGWHRTSQKAESSP